MDDNTIVEKEKKNKKVALVMMIVLCSISFLFGIVGGVMKFINFVDDSTSATEEDMMTPQEQEFSNGTFNILNGNNVVGTYKCEHTSCGYAYGVVDDNNFDLKVEELSEYQIKKLINNRFVLLYDDDEGNDTNHRSNGVKVYDYTTNKVVRELKAIKNYNKNDVVVFIAQNTDDKWGVIKFDNDKIVDMVNFEYDYIGAYLPLDVPLASQEYYAAKKNDDWIIINITNGEEYSKEFSSPIVAYDGEMVITKADFGFNVYDFKGNWLFAEAIDFSFPGSGLLVVSSKSKVNIFDTYAITSLFSRDYVQISGIATNESDKGYEVKINDEVVYTKDNKNKSQRNQEGADYDLIIKEEQM